MCIHGISTGDLYCVSGHRSNYAYGYVYKYNSGTGAWTKEGSLPGNNQYSITVNDDESQVVLVGDTPTYPVWYKNLPSGSWTKDLSFNPGYNRWNCSIWWDITSSKYYLCLISSTPYYIYLYSGAPGSWTLEDGPVSTSIYFQYAYDGGGRFIWVDSSGNIFYLTKGYTVSDYEGMYKYNGSTHTFYDMQTDGSDRAYPKEIAAISDGSIYVTDVSNANSIAYWNGSSISFQDVQAGGTSATYYGVYKLSA